MSPDETEKALQRLLDKDEIVDLVHRYSYLVDRRRYDELVELFTEDCVADYGPGIGPPFRGRDELRSMFGDRFVATSHHNANVLVTFDGEGRASVSTSLYAWHRAVDGTTPRVWGYYDDTVVRTPDGWRFAERHVRVAGSEGLDLDWLPLQDPA